MITFNNIPTTQRTPGVFVEVDNSRALKGLVPNPHKVLVLGQANGGTAASAVLMQITRENTAAGYFGAGSLLDRMCRRFKAGNPNTELWAIALASAGGVAASGVISFAGSATGAGTLYALIGGVQVASPITSGWSAADVASALKSDVNGNSNLCLRLSTNSAGSMFTLVQSRVVYMYANGSGEWGNGIDVRFNFYDGQTTPSGITYVLSGLENGAGNPNVATAWAIADGIQFQHIVNPYTDATNLAAVEAELAARFGPMVDLQGYAYACTRGTLASCAAIGLSHNSPHQTLVGMYDSPSGPEEWAAAWAAQCSASLESDPARPVHTLALVGIIPPTLASGNRFTQSERNSLLYDGIATWTVDASGNVMIERSVTTYRVNAQNIADPSYLDIETMFTLMSIRYQYKARMASRFIVPRFKLVNDGNPIPAGAMVASPNTVKQEIVALFTELRDAGLIENLDDFVTNLVVERDANDVNRVNALLPPNLVNQFRILAGQIQFIL